VWPSSQGDCPGLMSGSPSGWGNRNDVPRWGSPWPHKIIGAKLISPGGAPCLSQCQLRRMIRVPSERYIRGDESQGRLGRSRPRCRSYGARFGILGRRGYIHGAPDGAEESPGERGLAAKKRKRRKERRKGVLPFQGKSSCVCGRVPRAIALGCRVAALRAEEIGRLQKDAKGAKERRMENLECKVGSGKCGKAKG
jgi:hypothetical protein